MELRSGIKLVNNLIKNVMAMKDYHSNAKRDGQKC